MQATQPHTMCKQGGRQRQGTQGGQAQSHVLKELKLDAEGGLQSHVFASCCCAAEQC